jgi:RNA polymerase sigma factor for flagellar operon FliA
VGEVKIKPVTNRQIDAFVDLDASVNSQELMAQLVSEYGGLVKYLAQRMISKLPSHIMVEDLVSAGMIGLIDAVKKYDKTRNNQFKTYAEHRIRGEIIDEVRALDSLSRSMRSSMNNLERTIVELEKKLQRPAQDKDIAEALGVSVDEYLANEGRMRALSFTSLDEVGSSLSDDVKIHVEGVRRISDDDPAEYLVKRRTTEKVKNLMLCLPMKQRRVVFMYYFEDKNFKEIGKELKLTESRVSQLHKTAISKLKKVAPNAFEFE